MIIDWFTNLFKRGQNAVYINTVNICCDCHRSCRPSGGRPNAPCSAPVIHKGDTVTMIQYPIEVPAGPEADIDKTQIAYQVEGDVENEVPAVAGNGSTFMIVVPEASNGKVKSRFIDKAGNPGDWSPDAVWTNASDTTPPASPTLAPNIGKGQTV